MKYKLLLAVLVFGLAASCKKKYVCACGDMIYADSPMTPVFQVRGDKDKAVEKCAEYQNSQSAAPGWTCQVQ